MASLASQLFGAIVRRRNRGFDNGTLGVARLPAPVVSIGNLSVGGTGKTPAAIALATELRRRGLRVDVLTRGYRRQGRQLAIVEHGDEDFTLVGDEPLLIARRAQVPVIVHPDRFRAGLQAEHQFHTQIHLLDDGFQHRQLARSVDLVLVDPRDLDDRLLPAGRLREPPASLARASAVIWLGNLHTDAAAEYAHAVERLQPFTAAPIFLGSKQPRPLPADASRRLFGFCALARPESFRSTLQGLGVEIAGWRTFRDHHAYSDADLAALQQAAEHCGAEGLVTTEKDAVKLPPRLANVQVVSIDLQIERMPELIDRILQQCGL